LVNAPKITVVRPLCGLEFGIKETLQSAFDLDYPNFELVFGVASANDPVIPVVRRLMAAYPRVPARLLVGDERVSINPKLNNCIRGWRESASPWVVLADSNVLLPRDTLQRMQSVFSGRTGLVCSPPIGALPLNFWAEVECAFLNAYQARWQYFADSAGFGFAQG
jgi:ceramide glucosyltransferase